MTCTAAPAPWSPAATRPPQVRPAAGQSKRDDRTPNRTTLPGTCRLPAVYQGVCSPLVRGRAARRVGPERPHARRAGPGRAAARASGPPLKL